MQFVTSGPWESVYNSLDSSEAYEKMLYSASNVYKAPGANSWPMRPPFVVQKAAGTLGVPGSRFGDCMFEHVAEDGTSYRFLFVGGKVYRWDGTTTFTDVTPATPAIQSGVLGVYACSFADNLVVSDGVHKPWYVPSSGCSATPLVATQIDIDGAGTAWSAQGAPVVFDARLFFILGSLGGVNSFQDTIVWSEVANPALGYKQITAGYADFWELFQTDTRPIYALAATELSLVVLRAQSMLNITGKVDQTFTTNATRESVEGVGTRLPRSVLVHNGAVWFLDEQGRQYRYGPGSAPEPLWPQMADTVSAALASGSQLTVSDTTICYHSDLNLILATSFGAPSSVGTVLGAALIHVFSADSGKYQGAWDIDGLKTVHCLAVMRDSSTHPTLCALGESVINTNLGWTLSTSGQMWRQRRINEMVSGVSWADPSGPVASVTTHQLGRNEEAEWVFDELALRGEQNNAGAIPLTYYTPRGSSTPPTAILSSPPAIPINAAMAGAVSEARAVWGLGPNAQGRWIMAKVSCPTASQTTPPFTPTAIELRGIPTRANPQAP